MRAKDALGRQGEDVAASYLIDQGFTVVPAASATLRDDMAVWLHWIEYAAQRERILLVGDDGISISINTCPECLVMMTAEARAEQSRRGAKGCGVAQL